MLMHFDGRDLKPYAESVRPSELVEGETYFRLTFLDPEMTVPEMAPVVFVGRDLRAEEPGLYFQDAASYKAGERHKADGWVRIESLSELPVTAWKWGACRFDTFKEAEGTCVFAFEKALDQLLVCSLRRQHRAE